MDPNQSGNQMVSNAVETNRAVEYNWMFLLFIHTLISFLLFFFILFFFCCHLAPLSARFVSSTEFQSGDNLS